jgi:hypothetical protein
LLDPQFQPLASTAVDRGKRLFGRCCLVLVHKPIGKGIKPPGSQARLVRRRRMPDCKRAATLQEGPSSLPFRRLQTRSGERPRIGRSARKRRHPAAELTCAPLGHTGWTGRQGAPDFFHATDSFCSRPRMYSSACLANDTILPRSSRLNVFTYFRFPAASRYEREKLTL